MSEQHKYTFPRTFVCSNILKDGCTCNTIVMKYGKISDSEPFEVVCPKCSTKYVFVFRKLKDFPRGPIKAGNYKIIEREKTQD